MVKPRFWSAALATITALGGCIVSDQLSTLTIQPDGSADWVRVLSNIRSNETGSKGAEELRAFVASFDARTDDECKRVLEAGGRVFETRWLRREEPYANVLVARLPAAAALEKFLTFRGDKGESLVETHFTQTGRRRRLAIAVRMPRNHVDAEGPSEKPTLADFRREQADAISETRIAVATGSIVDSVGFTVAADKRSALFEPAVFEELQAKRPGSVDLYLEWEVPGA